MALALPDPYIGGDFAKDLTELPDKEYRAAIKERLDSMQRNFDKLARQFPVGHTNSAPGTVIGMWKTITTALTDRSFADTLIDQDMSSGGGWTADVTVPSDTDAWLDIEFGLPQIYSTVDDWMYCYAIIILRTGSDSIPEISGIQEAVTGDDATGYVADAIGEPYGPGGPQYLTLCSKNRLALPAGWSGQFAPLLASQSANNQITCNTTGHKPYFQYTMYTRES